MDPLEELAKLYGDYAEALKKPQFQELRRAPQPGDTATLRVLAELPKLDDAPSAIGQAVAWWREHGADGDEFSRMRRLHHLLRCLDRVLANLSPIRLSTEKGLLSLGSPWWVSYRRERNGEQRGARGEIPFSVETRPLTNIRLLPEPPRWASSRAFASRFTGILRQGCEGRCELRIGLCVLGRAAKTQFKKTDWLDTFIGLHGFRATAVTWDSAADGSVAEELRGCVEWARQNKVNVLCFPELAVDIDGRKALWDEILRDSGSLCLVIPGSFHEASDEESRWVNRSPVWLVESGEPVTIRARDWFDKTDPFGLPSEKVGAAFGELPGGCVEYKEDIFPGTSLTIVDTPVGRVGIAICKDAMRPSLIDQYGQAVDHMIVVSMNDKSTGWFWTSGETLARRDSVSALYVNSTQDVPEQNQDVDLAFWCFPDRTDLPNVVYRRRLPEKTTIPRDEALVSGDEVRIPDRRASARRIPDDYRVWVPVRIPGTLLDT